MNSPVAQAILLILVAAAMNAAYVLPMKLNKKWQWEHTWFAFSILGVAVVPTIIALLTVPQLWSTYSSVSGGILAAMALFGAGWGVSLVFFGLALFTGSGVRGMAAHRQAFQQAVLRLLARQVPFQLLRAP